MKAEVRTPKGTWYYDVPETGLHLVAQEDDPILQISVPAPEPHTIAGDATSSSET